MSLLCFIGFIFFVMCVGMLGTEIKRAKKEKNYLSLLKGLNIGIAILSIWILFGIYFMRNIGPGLYNSTFWR